MRIFISIILFLNILVCSAQNEQEYLSQLSQYALNGNKVKEAETLNKLASYYWENNKPNEAIDFFNKSLVINIELGNKNAQMRIYENIGMLYTDINQFETAILNYRKANIIANDFADTKHSASLMINIGILLQKLKRYQESISQTEQALEIAKTTNDLKLTKSCYGVLSESYEKIGDNLKSMEYFNLYATFEKYLQNEAIKEKEKENAAIVAQANQHVKEVESKKNEVEKDLVKQTETLKMTQKISKQQEEEIKSKEIIQKALKAELKQKQLTLTVIIIGLILAILLSLLVLRSNNLRKKANKLLAEQNNEILEQQEIIKKKNLDITKSITYAQRIQKAMLPEQSQLNEIISESFILFKPRELVSGDFYWFDYVFSKSDIFSNSSDIHNNDEIIIAAVDCTGHGVPGAFMSLIGFNLLDHIVGNNITDPGKILDFMHAGVNSELKQEQTDNQDGMDIVLCKINKKEKLISYAGAKNPLVYVQNNELFIIKGDKFPIGGAKLRNRSPFTTHSVSYKDAPITLYLYSDGFQDQFGGEDGQKFMSTNFRKLLFEISSKSMSEQKNELEATLNNWLNNKHKQIDDILIIGLRLS